MPQTRQHARRRSAQIVTRANQADPGVHVTRESMEEFLEACRTEGRVEGTLKWYQRGLNYFYEALPEDKTVRHGTLERWREELLQKGYAPGTINSFLSVSNSYLDFVGHREYQLASQLKPGTELRPELTRSEYLRLLQTARALDREKEYLLVKLFGSTGLTVQELSKVTVEAVEEGEVVAFSNRVKQIHPLPKGLRKELLDYARRNGRLSGPLFLTKEGAPLSRTYVTTIIRQLCAAAKVGEEKGNPRCLKRLYQTTRSGIEGNIALLVEQAHERLLAQEQLEIGWEER